jgi:hypothetical protein
MADEGTPPPVPLNLRAEAHSVDALIDTVIIYAGPGSWKREAYWDEYILTLTNHGEHPVDLTSATLVDFQGNSVMPGDDPWELQEQSKEWIKNYDSGTTGVVLKVGASMVLIGTAAVGTLALIGPGVMAGGAAVAVPVAAIATLPFIGIGTILVNVEGRLKIEEEYQRRRLALPAVIQPGQACRGSLFFRIAPGPKKLILVFSVPDSQVEVPVDLTSLSDLHIEKKPEPMHAD